MQFSESDWEKLDELQSRLILDTHSRTALLYQTFADNAGHGAVENLRTIPGRIPFFTELNYLIRVTDDEELLARYLESLLKYTFNQVDKSWLINQIEHRKSSKVTTKETHLLIEAFRSVLDSDSVLCEGLLTQAKELDSFYFTTPPQTKEQLVQGYFSHVFPLQCYRRTLSEFQMRGLTLASSASRKNIIICKDLLVIVSFPGMDKKKVISAMQHAWNINVLDRAVKSQSLETADKQFAEDLLISTWAQISNVRFGMPDVVNLFHRDPNDLNLDNKRKSMLFGKVHVLPQPTDFNKSGELREWYANRCLDELRGPRPKPADPVGALNRYIQNLTEMQAVVAMFITKDRTETIEELKKHFPQLVLLELSECDADRYSDIQSEISLIDGHIENICKQS